MKVCSSCQRLYPDDGGFCPIDGQKLVLVAEAPVPTDADDKRVGASVCEGRYKIYRKVADGGMGRVYQALDLQDDRGVALKILHPDVASDEVSVLRFKREFEVSSELPHGHIVEVRAFQRTEDDSYALVMEYLEGEELRMVLKREKTMPPERVVRIVSQVALGLAGAHERKVVHRDLKPDNVFLSHTSEGDTVKILDFGSVRDNSEGAKKLTVMGTTIGSPFYMAPEQAQGLPSLDHRADVWSLAAIAYEAMTGTVPFRGATGPAILLAILTQEPVPPSEVTAHQKVPATLDTVFEEALTKDPDIRIKTIGALADRIGQALGLEGTHDQWATMPQDELRKRIEAGLPAVLAKHEADKAAAADLSRMDEVMASSPNLNVVAPAQFDEDIVMGMPSGTPKWLVPVIAGTCVLLGAIVVLVFVL